MFHGSVPTHARLLALLPQPETHLHWYVPPLYLYPLVSVPMYPTLVIIGTTERTLLYPDNFAWAFFWQPYMCLSCVLEQNLFRCLCKIASEGKLIKLSSSIKRLNAALELNTLQFV